MSRATHRPRWQQRLGSFIEWGLVIVAGLCVLAWLTVLPVLGFRCWCCH